MNYIRHVLATNLVFRKLQRDRAVGRTLGQFYQDLDCFVGGGFRKEFCVDMQEQKEKERHSTASVQPRIRQHENPDKRRRKLRHLMNKWFRPYTHRWGLRYLLFQLWRTLDRLSSLDLARAQISNRIMHMHPTSCLTFMRYSQA